MAEYRVLTTEEKIVLLIAAINEPTRENMQKVIDERIPMMYDERRVLDNTNDCGVWSCKRALHNLVCKKLRDDMDVLKREAWELNHPGRENLTEEQKKEIDACESIIFSYKVIDRPTWSDNDLRDRADEAERRIHKIKQDYDNSYRTGLKYKIDWKWETK